MMSIVELQRLRKDRDIALRDVAAYGGISFNYLSELENEKHNLTMDAYEKIIRGINRCHFAKKNGTYHREDLVKPEDKQKPGRKPKDVSVTKPVKPTVKPKKKPTPKPTVSNETPVKSETDGE